MSKKRIIEKLRPLRLIKKMIDYVKDDSCIYKLFVYSKFYQKKLNIDLIDYKEIYISKLGMKFSNLLIFYYRDKSVLNNYLNDFIIKNKLDINFNEFQKIVVRHFERIINNYKFNTIFFIDINSPFLDLLSKSKIFNNFIIIFKTNGLEEFNLKNNYISIFEKMNMAKSNYSAIDFRYKNNGDINYLNDLKINFGQIKGLFLFQEKNTFIENYDVFYQNLFSINNIGNSLICLSLNIFNNNNNPKNKNIIQIESKCLESINNFKLLRFLELKGFYFKEDFKINLINLEILSIKNCRNIIYTDKNYLDLKTLRLNWNTNVRPKSILKLQKLRKCYIFNNNSSSMIDFSSLAQLRILQVETSDFLKLENNILLNEIQLYSHKNITKEKEIQMVEKILSMKNLNNVSFKLNHFDDINEVLDIKGENSSIKSIQIKIKNNNKDLAINKIQNKFPNLSQLSVCIYRFNINNNNNNNIRITIKINQNLKNTINKFELIVGGNKNIKIDIQPFENIEEFIINLSSNIPNIKNLLPFFNNDIGIKYNSLINFGCNYLFQNVEEINLEFLKNLYYNIDNMPNLKKFYLRCFSKDLDEDFYMKLIRKLLALKLDKIYLEIKNNNSNNNITKIYTIEELKLIYPEINVLNLNNCIFKKLNN